jgi:sortase A
VTTQLAEAQVSTSIAPTSSQASPSEATQTVESPPIQPTPITTGPDYPVELYVSSINLSSPIVRVGVNAKGEMDVPSGKTKQAGWYKFGTIPGETGSAVLDAHVYAAFSNLKKLNVGDSVYVNTESGKQLHFRVIETTVYPLAQVPLQRLFNRDDGRYLNLITCAGTFIRKTGTYDHRLIVYTELVAN